MPTSLQDTFQPDPIAGNIDPATGMCTCTAGDPNNPFGPADIIITATMNPSPGTPNNTGAPNGTGPCP